MTQSPRHINKYLDVDCVRNMTLNSLRTTIAAWLNDSHRSEVCVGMNTSTRSNGIEIALNINIASVHIKLAAVDLLALLLSDSDIVP